MNHEDLEIYLAEPTLTLVEAMKKIDENTKGILYIVDKDKKLIGTVTDGDIRRWIIKTCELSAQVLKFMHRTPKYLFEGNRAQAKSFMIEKQVKSLPILDSDMRIIEIVFDSLVEFETSYNYDTAMRDTPVIIMAGGKGTRLYPYTKILPKPLIPIGDIPIVERIMNRFCAYGVSKYYLTVNYKKGMIKSYFAELNPIYHVNYIEEDKPLGTAGSIKLIKEVFRTPVIITNCDILIDADYSSILQYHIKSGNGLTIVSALKNIVVPYGVLHMKEQGIVTSMEEKPKLSYFVNTGMYILEPELIEKIPDDTFFHMTDLANLLIKEGYQVGTYPVSEDSFLDMGEFEEMHRMETKLSQKLE